MDIFSEKPRPSFPVGSFHHQHLLSKALFEHVEDVSTIAAVAASSSSIRHSSLAANLGVNLEINGTTIPLFDIVFAPKECFSIQLVRELSIYCYREEKDSSKEQAEPGRIRKFISDLILHTKYFSKTIRSIKLQNSKNRFWNGIFTGFGTCENLLLNLESFQLLYPSLPISEEMIESVKSKQLLPYLKTLRFSTDDYDNDNGDDYAILMLAQVPELSELTILQNRVSAAAFAALGNMLSTSNFKKLELWSTYYVTDEAFTHVRKLTSLEILYIQNCDNLTDLALEYLFDGKNEEGKEEDFLMFGENLIDLSLNCCDFTEEGFEVFSRRPFPRLQILDVSCCRRFEPVEGLQHISCLPNLSELNLNQNTNLTDASLLPLEKLKFLKKVDLSYCSNLTNLSGLISNSLRILDISSTDLQIGKEVAEGLAKLTPSLERVRMIKMESSFSLQDLDEVKKALPNCSFFMQ
jgi:hypothetical protein